MIAVFLVLLPGLGLALLVWLHRKQTLQRPATRAKFGILCTRLAPPCIVALLWR